MSSPQAPSIFNAAARRSKRLRAARMDGDFDFLWQEAAADVVDRLETVLKRFDTALFYGPAAATVKDALTDKADVGEVVLADSVSMRRDIIEADAAALPFGDAQFDLVVSVMALHAVDHIHGALVEARRVLKPDGLFIAIFPGERTLTELRLSLQAAETTVLGRVSARVMPFVAVKDGGALLQAAGFALPVSDVATVPVSYQDPFRLFRDLRGMGETSHLKAGPKGALRRDVMGAALTHYREHYGNSEGGVRARFDLVCLTGWAPHGSQPKPLRPGSAKMSLADAVKDFDPSTDQ